MKWKMTLEKDPDLLRVEVSGDFTAEGYARMLGDIAGHPAWHDSMNALMDYRATDLWTGPGLPEPGPRSLRDGHRRLSGRSSRARLARRGRSRMIGMRRTLLLSLVTMVVACGAEPDSAGTADGIQGVAATAARAVPRTADPGQRGLAEADFPRVQQLADNVYSYEALRSAGDERFTTVSLFVVTPEGVLVADGQGSVEETERLIAAIGDITDQPITHLVICSDHGDHTGGNSAFAGDPTVYAHPTSATLLRAASARRASSGTPSTAPLPDVLVDDVERLTLGGTEIEIHFLGRAHTGGDLVVHLPTEKILFMSEAYLNRVFPAMRSAYPSEWVSMIERAQAMEVETYVPGHGFVESPTILAEELEVYRQAVVRVIAESRRLHDAGVPLEDAAGMADFGDLESWSLSSSQRARAIQQVYAELEGTLPGG